MTKSARRGARSSMTNHAIAAGCSSKSPQQAKKWPGLSGSSGIRSSGILSSFLAGCQCVRGFEHCFQISESPMAPGRLERAEAARGFQRLLGAIEKLFPATGLRLKVGACPAVMAGDEMKHKRVGHIARCSEQGLQLVAKTGQQGRRGSGLCFGERDGRVAGDRTLPQAVERAGIGTRSGSAKYVLEF